MKNKPVYIVIHCSATPENKEFTAEDINRCHRRRGIADAKGIGGYHYYLPRKGGTVAMRPEQEIGAHDNYKVPGKSYSYNYCSIGICYEGGLDKDGKAKDTRTPEQKEAMEQLVKELRGRYPITDILGHRDTSPDRNGDGKITPDEYLKECPCFDVKKVLKYLLSIVAVVCLCSCSTKQVNKSNEDYLRIIGELREAVVKSERCFEMYKDSTGLVKSPVEKSSNVADSSSYLETSYAISKAGIRDGKLYHSIYNKDSIPAKICFRYIRYEAHDTLRIESADTIYRDKRVETNTVTRKKLWGESFFYTSGWLLWLLFVGMAIKVWYKIKNKKR